MKRIDIIALNGATGDHYKYEEVADKILDIVYEFAWSGICRSDVQDDKDRITKILVEAFPNDA